MPVPGALGYISGPMTGIKKFNHPKFIEAATVLRQRGFRVLNPAEQFYCITGLELERYLTRDLVELIYCDFIALLPGWENSKGAKIEVTVALATGKEFVLLEDALDPRSVKVEVVVSNST